ncbi:NYN domain-containing protein [Frankia sp. ACN10a]|uniref:NYN domain-containing protein n=1 Tax=Frankia sp. ACN10a TaxID=2926031 RepID=UPI0021185BF2|nr:NYN domain-containing protein [Frankia sp. ACN10a]
MVIGAASARLAVLIDAENAPSWSVGLVLADVARYGKAQVKRAYGDWTTLTSWKKALLDLSIRPVQVFAAVKGKNAADLALAIDAMDLLHSGAVDGFALLSSDSDFTRLAERIREAGLPVYGYGEEKKTNPGLPAACDLFVFVESLAVAAPPMPAATPDQVLVPARVTTPTRAPLGAAGDAAAPAPAAAVAPPKESKNAKIASTAPPSRATTAALRADTVLMRRLREAVTANPGPDGWTHLAAVGSAIRKHPAVVLKTYGYSRLKDLMVATGLFEVQRSGPGKSGAVHARIK